MSLLNMYQQMLAHSKSQELRPSNQSSSFTQRQPLEPDTPSFKLPKQLQDTKEKPAAQPMRLRNMSKNRQPTLKRPPAQSYRINIASNSGEITNRSMLHNYSSYLEQMHLQQNTQSFNQDDQIFNSQTLDTINLARLAQGKSATNILSKYPASQKVIRAKSKQQFIEKDRSRSRLLIRTPVLDEKKAKEAVKQKSRADKLIEDIIDMQNKLQATLNILESSQYESDLLLNKGKMGRMETIVNSKMTVDTNQLYKLASQLQNSRNA